MVGSKNKLKKLLRDTTGRGWRGGGRGGEDEDEDEERR
jgi:hypothetical protein